jgi:hypothetical protein
MNEALHQTPEPGWASRSSFNDSGEEVMNTSDE